MADEKRRDAGEIVSLNMDWGEFDLDKLSVEELEHRFELALAVLPPGPLEDCGINDCVGFGSCNCADNGCVDFCNDLP